MIEYHNMDCVTALKKYKDKYFDLAIVDPPYFDGPIDILPALKDGDSY